MAGLIWLWQRIASPITGGGFAATPHEVVKHSPLIKRKFTMRAIMMARR